MRWGVRGTVLRDTGDKCEAGEWIAKTKSQKEPEQDSAVPWTSAEQPQGGPTLPGPGEV